jgi:hypothetical protein
MGVRADIREEVRNETVTKIHGQPTNQDLTTLEKELIAILANIPTTLGGGKKPRTCRNPHGTSQVPSNRRSPFQQSRSYMERAMRKEKEILEKRRIAMSQIIW